MTPVAPVAPVAFVAPMVQSAHAHARRVHVRPWRNACRPQDRPATRLPTRAARDLQPFGSGGTKERKGACEPASEPTARVRQQNRSPSPVARTCHSAGSRTQQQHQQLALETILPGVACSPETRFLVEIVRGHAQAEIAPERARKRRCVVGNNKSKPLDSDRYQIRN